MRECWHTWACVRGCVSVSLCVSVRKCVNSHPRTRGVRSLIPRTESFPPADFNSLALLVFASRVDGLQWV